MLDSFNPTSITPTVTIVVVPRERFSYARESLESIFANTSIPFSLVYVDGGSPAYVQQYLKNKAQEKQFQLIRTEHFLSPNQARNLALKQINTQYVLFIDNDVIVTPGWLEKLLNCAAETQATVVCPLTCIGKNLHQKIHLAGGEARIIVDVKGDRIRRKVHEKHYFVNRPVADVQDQLRRQPCEFAEFHCMLVQTAIFEKTGELDEGLLSTREHIDFCLTVTQAGGTFYCEPESVVTYVPDIIFRLSDLAYFMLRWSDAWELKSLEHFQTKWDLSKDSKYFQKRYQRLGYRRHEAFIKPLVRKLTLGQPAPWLEKLLIDLEHKLNHFVTRAYMRRHPQVMTSLNQGINLQVTPSNQYPQPVASIMGIKESV
jgi:GT2 family glycosyltransferase